MQMPRLIRQVIETQDALLEEEVKVDERVKEGEDRATVERESQLWADELDHYWELCERIASQSNAESNEAAKLAQELLDLRWRKADLLWELENVISSEQDLLAAKDELQRSEARINEIQALLSLMGPAPTAPALEVVPAGSPSHLLTGGSSPRVLAR